jgi:iron-sulfur cluster repair protein YtfE (RIC family)
MHTCTIPEPASERSAELARLRLLARKVALVHGGHQPRMVELATVVSRIANTPAAAPAAEDLAALVRLTDAFSPWPGACGSVHALFTGLQALRA